MSWTLCTSGSAILKAGINANSDLIASGSQLLILSDNAEGRVEAETRRSWVASYSGLTTPIKNALSDACSSLIATDIIAYDPTGYLAREADILLNVNDEKYTAALRILKEFKPLRTP